MLEEGLPGHFVAQVCEAVGPLVQIRLVDLLYVAREHYLGALPGPGDDGLDLMRGEILGFVYDEENPAQTAAADIGQRGDEKLLVFEHRVYLQGLAAARLEAVAYHVEIVHQRLYERGHLALLVAREEAQVLIAKYHCRSREYDLVESGLLLQGGGKGQKRLARAGPSGEADQFDCRVQAGVEGEFLLVVARTYAVGLA